MRGISIEVVMLAVAALTHPAMAAGAGALGASSARRYDQNVYLLTHNAYSTPVDGFSVPNQASSLQTQLERGARALNPDVYYIEEGFCGIQATLSYEDADLTKATLTACQNVFVRAWGPDVVVAHNPGVAQYLFHPPHVPPPTYRTYAKFLQDVSDWLGAHVDEVITLVPEVGIHVLHQELVETVYDRSGVRDSLFYTDRPNVGIQVPDRPAGEWWDISKHGFPTLDQLVSWGKRIVLLPNQFQPGFPQPWPVVVQTVGGDDDHDPNTWTNNRPDSAPINDFTRALFVMQHEPKLPGLLPPAGFGYNDSDILSRRLSAIVTRWNRLPTHPQFDFFDYDSSHAVGSDHAAPIDFVRALNAAWQALPEVHAMGALNPPANSSGWNNTDVGVHMMGAKDEAIQAIASSVFGAETRTLQEGTTMYQLSAEGVSTVSFATIGPLGVRSEQQLLDVRIDKTPPAVPSCTGNAGTYVADDSISIVCDSADALSGIQSVNPRQVAGEVYLFGPGMVTIPIVARDFAGNESMFELTFLVVVDVDSLERLTTKFVTKAAIVNALLRELEAVRRAQARGQASVEAVHISSYIQLLQNQTGRFVTPDDVAVLSRLALAL